MRIRGVALYANLNKGGHERLPCEQPESGQRVTLAQLCVQMGPSDPPR